MDLFSALKADIDIGSHKDTNDLSVVVMISVTLAPSSGLKRSRLIATT